MPDVKPWLCAAPAVDDAIVAAAHTLLLASVELSLWTHPAYGACEADVDYAQDASGASGRLSSRCQSLCDLGRQLVETLMDADGR